MVVVLYKIVNPTLSRVSVVKNNDDGDDYTFKSNMWRDTKLASATGPRKKDVRVCHDCAHTFQVVYMESLLKPVFWLWPCILLRDAPPFSVCAIIVFGYEQRLPGNC